MQPAGGDGVGEVTVVEAEVDAEVDEYLSGGGPGKIEYVLPAYTASQMEMTDSEEEVSWRAGQGVRGLSFAVSAP
eukprot:1180296-Prorocentrum_minimum.AAC.4